MDTLILVGIAACQLILAGLGFHVTNHPPQSKGWKLGLDAAFWAVGLVGLGLLVWSGLRTQASQEQLNGQIAGLEKKQSVGFAEIKKDLTGQPGAINQSPLPQPQPQQAKSPIPPAPHAQLAVTKYTFEPINSADINGDHTVKATFQNTGDASASYPLANIGHFVSGGLVSDADLNKAFAQVERPVLGGRVGTASDFQLTKLAAPLWIKDPAPIASADWRAIVSGSQRVYVMAVFAYRDKNLKGGFWITEDCTSVSALVYNPCPVHNRTWLHR